MPGTASIYAARESALRVMVSVGDGVGSALSSVPVIRAGHPPVTRRLGDNGDGPAAGAHEMDRERADETVTSRG